MRRTGAARGSEFYPRHRLCRDSESVMPGGESLAAESARPLLHRLTVLAPKPLSLLEPLRSPIVLGRAREGSSEPPSAIPRIVRREICAQLLHFLGFVTGASRDSAPPSALNTGLDDPVTVSSSRFPLHHRHECRRAYWSTLARFGRGTGAFA